MSWRLSASPISSLSTFLSATVIQPATRACHQWMTCFCPPPGQGRLISFELWAKNKSPLPEVVYVKWKVTQTIKSFKCEDSNIEDTYILYTCLVLKTSLRIQFLKLSKKGKRFVILVVVPLWLQLIRVSLEWAGQVQHLLLNIHTEQKPLDSRVLTQHELLCKSNRPLNILHYKWNADRPLAVMARAGPAIMTVHVHNIN